jgi:hypothetical protein
MPYKLSQGNEQAAQRRVGILKIDAIQIGLCIGDQIRLIKNNGTRVIIINNIKKNSQYPKKKHNDPFSMPWEDAW